MPISSWQVFMWPKVSVKVPELLDASVQFRSFGTSLQIGAENSELCRGSTVWGCDLSGSRVAIAWEWVAIQPRVVVLTDPMMLVSNINLVDEQGERLLESQLLLRLHEVVFALPWQRDVEAARWPDQYRLAA